MPIQVSLDGMSNGAAEHPCDHLNNVGLGGLCFISHQFMPVGRCVSVSFPLLDNHCALEATVVWNRQHEKGFEVGLQFNDPDQLYCLRMIEQVFHIEHYRREVEKQDGRHISSEQAAREWISRYAGEFPMFEL